VRAVDGVNLQIARASGWGWWANRLRQNTLGKTILRLVHSTSGHILLETPPEVVAQITALEAKE